jgi:small-conductance mechanosensitive channel
MRVHLRTALVFLCLVVLCAVGVWWGRGWQAPTTAAKGSPGHALAVWHRVLKATVWALAPPLGLWIVSGGLTTLSGGDVTPPIAHLISLIAEYLLVLRLAKLLLDPGGLVVRFAAGTAAAAGSLLMAIRLITVAGMVLVAPARVFGADPYAWERIPQLLELLAMATIGVTLAILLRHQGPVVRQWTQRGSSTRKLFRVLGLIVPLGIAGLIVFDLLGYRAGAVFIFRNQFRTLSVILILALLYRLAMRVGSRLSSVVTGRIIEQDGYVAASEGRAKLEKFLARSTALIIIALAAIVLREAFHIGDTGSEILHRVRLWDAGDGDWVTLLDVVDAILLILVGNLVSQALTQTYALVIAPLKGKDVAGRQYATLSMVRYLIMAIAITAALLTLKFSPSRLGWLLTAVSVGLGFGLQEIVANFVSGLVIMIERPIRVGDVITVGQTGGTVQEISMRATQVTNWDRQTIIVPNRNFITQEVTNWTRQDQVVRRTMPIGVAYGSDVEQVLRILDETVNAHDKVLKDPGSRTWFLGFGDFTLNFEVWFYATYDDGLRTRTELFTQIYARLQEADIQIPFPVRDVRMHVEPDGAPPSSKTVGVPEKEPPPQAPEPGPPATASTPDPPTEPAPGAESAQVTPPDEA